MGHLRVHLYCDWPTDRKLSLLNGVRHFYGRFDTPPYIVVGRATICGYTMYAHTWRKWLIGERLPVGLFGLGGEKETRSESTSMGVDDRTYHISYDMMLKGNIAKRGRQQVRQFGVSIGGTTRIVTSGDMVNQEIYEALLAAKAIDPNPISAPEPVDSATDAAPPAK